MCLLHRLVLLALVVGLSVRSVAASPVSFTNLAAFQTAAVAAGIPLTLQTFDAAADDFSSPITVAPLTFSNGTGVALTNEGVFNIGGSGKVVWFTGNLTVTFANAVNAFGTGIFDLGTDPSGPVTFTYTLSNGGTGTLFSNVTGFTGFERFGGVIDSTPFSSITFHNTSTIDAVVLDDARFGAGTTTVPEPFILSMLGLGLAGMGARRWRRRV